MHKLTFLSEQQGNDYRQHRWQRPHGNYHRQHRRQRPHGNRRSNRQNAARFKPRRCFYCRCPGHVVRNCWRLRRRRIANNNGSYQNDASTAVDDVVVTTQNPQISDQFLYEHQLSKVC